jgi:hypothetical protein
MWCRISAIGVESMEREFAMRLARTCLKLSLFFALTMLLPTGMQAADAATSASSMQQQMQAMANNPSNAAHSAHFQAAANAAERAAAAMAEKPPDNEAAAAALKDALRVLVDAAWNGANVADIAMQIGGALLELGAFNEHGLEQLQGLLALLEEAHRLQSSTSGASLEQSMAIRELVLALHSVIDNGWHDFWHSIKALQWYINAAASGVYLDDVIAQLLAFVDSGDFSAEAAANIVQMIEELVQGIKDGTISGGSVKEVLDRIRDAISDETRRIANDRKEQDRQQAEADERAEREAAQATVSRYGATGTTNYGPTIFGPYIRDVDSDNWKAGTTPPIRPPEIVWQAPAGPQGPTAPGPVPEPAIPTAPTGPTTLPTPPPTPSVPAPIPAAPLPTPITPAPVAPGPPPVPIGPPIGPGPMGPGVTPAPPPLPPTPGPAGPPPGPPPGMGPF